MSLKDVTLAFGGPRVLDGVSLSISKGLRAALTGRNGEGKSTLMKVLAGTLEPDGGEIVRAPNLKVIYVGQGVEAEEGQGQRSRSTEELPDSAVHLHLKPPPQSGGQIRKARLEEALLARPDLLLLDEPTNHLDVEAIDWLEGMIRRQREMAVLIVTHDRRFLKRVATEIFDLDRGELSGWPCDYATFVKRKQELLADEAVYWERKAKKLREEEAWIRRGVKARTTRNEGRVAALKKLRAEFAARRTQVGTTSLRIDTAAPGGVRVLKIEDLGFSYGCAVSGGPRSRVAAVAPERDPPRSEDVAPYHAGPSCAVAQERDPPRSTIPHSSFLIRHFTADVLRGERIGILGGNGAGKTTLLNLLTGRLRPTEGSVTLGTNVQMAFFDQLRTELKPELTVGENVAADRDEVVVGGVKKHIYSYLADFLFTPERVRTPVKALSGGERTRLLLAKLFMTPANLLVMDEPTNDLDVETLELLEEQLLAYKGTLLLVSHDREFLDNVVTSTFVLEGDGEVRCYPGGWEDYLRQRSPHGRARTPAAPQSQKNGDASGNDCGGPGVSALPCEKTSRHQSPPPPPSSTSAPKKLSYNEKRELEALPAKIETLEAEVGEIRAALADGAIYRDDPKRAQELTARLPAAEAELEAAVDRWAVLEERSS